jgi:transposase InsO family protein
MSKPDPTRYRTTNWSYYNAALRKRGSINFYKHKRPHQALAMKTPAQAYALAA